MRHPLPPAPCLHDWRLESERTTGPAPGFEDEPFVSWRRWYCTKCRTIETIQEPTAQEAERERQTNRERERLQREAWKSPTPEPTELTFRNEDRFANAVGGVVFLTLVGVLVIICLVVIGTFVMRS